LSITGTGAGQKIWYRGNTTFLAPFLAPNFGTKMAPCRQKKKLAPNWRQFVAKIF
jgi:hypothetical protein